MLQSPMQCSFIVLSAAPEPCYIVVAFWALFFTCHFSFVDMCIECINWAGLLKSHIFCFYSTTIFSHLLSFFNSSSFFCSIFCSISKWILSVFFVHNQNRWSYTSVYNRFYCVCSFWQKFSPFFGFLGCLELWSLILIKYQYACFIISSLLWKC